MPENQSPSSPKTLGIDLTAMRAAAVKMAAAYRSANGELAKVDPDVLVDYLAALDPVRMIALCDTIVGMFNGEVQYTTFRTPNSAHVH